MSIIAKVKNLRLSFPKGKKMLFNDLSVSVKRGEKVLLLGPSGCGKSTLLNVLSGLIPHSIEVPMKVKEIIHPCSWGYIFQDPDTQFCMPYVDEEIAFALENVCVRREEMPARIMELLACVDLQLTNPHTDIRTLSGGMKQRLAIASTLAHDPEVLFLDEPTAMLNPKGTKEVWQAVSRIAKDKTLIIVEHKLDYVLDLVDRVILFNLEGEIIADGMKGHIFKFHRDLLRKAGIWYPGAREEYLQKNQALFQEKLKMNGERVILKDFKGYIQKNVKIEVPFLEVEAGEWIAITGGNGAGKTTLLYALMQLLKTTGTYLVNGTPIEQINIVTDHCAFVFQNPEYQFLTNSVYDEVAYSLRIDHVDEKEIRTRVTELLHLFLLKEQEEQHPYQLSVGQKRRLSVATALIKKPPILLLDEPTFGLDARNTFRLLELLEQYRQQGVTILMSTHDQFIANRVATRKWRIDEGCLVEIVQTGEDNDA